MRDDTLYIRPILLFNTKELTVEYVRETNSLIFGSVQKNVLCTTSELSKKIILDETKERERRRIVEQITR